MTELLMWIAQNVHDPRLIDELTNKLKAAYQSGYDVGYIDGWAKGHVIGLEEGETTSLKKNGSRCFC